MSILDEPAFPIVQQEAAKAALELLLIATDAEDEQKIKAAKNLLEAAVVKGMSICAYAAIHLCVPMSGDEELDAMIRVAQRQRLAGMATIEDIAFQMNDREKTIPEARYDHADAMIVELEKNHVRHGD